MALIRCKECGKEVSDQAKSCPLCGCPIENTNSVEKQNKVKNKVGLLLFAFAFLLICICIYIGMTSQPGNAGANSIDVDSNKNQSLAEKEPEDVKDDFSDVELIYELSAGYYTAGIDIPSGRCNVFAVSGKGNLQSSNMFNGGVNEMFGIDEGMGLYTESFNGLKLPEGTVLSTNSGMVIRLEYSVIEGRASGRTYDTESAAELGAGNYLAGTDFPAGVYSFEAVSGNGNLTSTNLFEGGVNEMFGIDNGYGFYAQTIQNIELPEGTELSISGDLKVKMIPSK